MKFARRSIILALPGLFLPLLAYATGEAIHPAIAEPQPASADPATASTVAEQPNEDGRTSSSRAGLDLSEVIVTAEKYSQPLLDVPMSVSALTGAQLMRSQSYNLEDYVGTVPGVSLIEHIGLGKQVVIRGITSGSATINNAAATYIDETPFTAVGANGALVISPDLDTFDMERIEVLRGPQGTLYGADALGGLMKYVTAPPDPSAFYATIEAGLTSMYGGATGHDVHEMINIPVGSMAALRVVGYGNYYPGFIDDPSRALSHTNSSHFTGGRASFLFAPIGSFSVRLNALYQQRLWNDFSNEDVNPMTLTPIYGPLVQEKPISSTGQSIVQLYSATMKWDSPIAQLLSSTSYYSMQPKLLEDDRPLDAALTAILKAPYGGGLGFINNVRALTQELRLTSVQSRAFRWLVGGYFTNQRQQEIESVLPISLSMQEVLENFTPNLGVFNSNAGYKEYAGYGNFTYNITRTLSIGVGGRYSHNRQNSNGSGVGLFFAGTKSASLASANVTTYSGDIRWKPSPGDTVYARVAEGYAPGGANPSIPVTSSLPSVYAASRTRDYEAGIKNRFLDGRLVSQLDGFHILWQQVQLLALVGGFSGIVNGSSAESNGVEWDLAYAPVNSLTLDFNGSYTHAYLTANTPAFENGHTGDRLPGVPLLQMSLSPRYMHHLIGRYDGFLGLTWRFTGSRYSDFTNVGPRQTMPRFNMLDLRAGIESEEWSATLYVKNVANQIAINYVAAESGRLGGLGPQDATVYPPRMIGVTVTANIQ